ncbi:hypothetical protein [uncultured Faecalibaculum sp.]|nr:hypothetical protein [uncultured Faecalibaculum sp.]
MRDPAAVPVLMHYSILICSRWFGQWRRTVKGEVRVKGGDEEEGTKPQME